MFRLSDLKHRPDQPISSCLWGAPLLCGGDFAPPWGRNLRVSYIFLFCYEIERAVYSGVVWLASPRSLASARSDVAKIVDRYFKGTPSTQRTALISASDCGLGPKKLFIRAWVYGPWSFEYVQLHLVFVSFFCWLYYLLLL